MKLNGNPENNQEKQLHTIISVLRTLIFTLLFFISKISFGNIDTTAKEVVEVKTIVLSKPSILKYADTLLVSSTLLDPEEDMFTPSFFSVGSGLYKFPILLNLDDNDWISENVMLSLNKIEFKTDTIPSFSAKYDHAYTTAHWFTGRFDRMIGKSKLSAQLNRNFQNSVYSNSKGKRFNFSIGSELPFHKNYKVTLSYFRNQAELNENGGFNNADSIIYLDELNATTLNSNLNSASNSIFLQKTSILQEVGLSSFAKFFVASEYEENHYSFELLEEDIDANFFSHTYIDTTETFDSIGFRKLIIEPSFALRNLNKNNEKSILHLGVRKEINDKSILNNSYVLSKLNINFNNGLPVYLQGKYHFENAWKGNYSIKGSTNLRFKKETIDTIQYLSNLFIQVDYSSLLPSYLFLNYFGNHFQWNNDFNPTQKITFDARLNLAKFRSIVELEVQNVSNYIYLDENSLPNQNNKNITAGRISLKNQWGTKHIKLYSGLGYQYSTSNLIRVPSFFSRSSLVYEFKLRKVPFNMGSTLNFFSKYVGLNYNPAIRHYYLGNKNVGGTPVVDFFLASRLGPADLYIKYDNTFYTLNRDLFIGENYPITNSFLRFGLKWNLTN